MTFRLFAAVSLILTACAPVAAQSVTGLSTKPPAAPVIDEIDVESIKTLLGLANKLASELTKEQRETLERALSGRRPLLESGTAVNLAVPAGATTSFGENGQASAGPRGEAGNSGGRASTAATCYTLTQDRPRPPSPGRGTAGARPGEGVDKYRFSIPFSYFTYFMYYWGASRRV